MCPSRMSRRPAACRLPERGASVFPHVLVGRWCAERWKWLGRRDATRRRTRPDLTPMRPCTRKNMSFYQRREEGCPVSAMLSVGSKRSPCSLGCSIWGASTLPSKGTLCSTDTPKTKPSHNCLSRRPARCRFPSAVRTSWGTLRQAESAASAVPTSDSRNRWKEALLLRHP